MYHFKCSSTSHQALNQGVLRVTLCVYRFPVVVAVTFSDTARFRHIAFPVCHIFDSTAIKLKEIIEIIEI